MAKKQIFTTIGKVNDFNTTMPLLQSMYNEFKEFSKKKPEAVVSKNKILIVNRLLVKIRTIIEDQESINYLDILNEDDLPQISDVTIMLSQYVAAMSAYKEKYCPFNDEELKNIWLIK